MSSILDEPLPLRDFDQSNIDSYILLINESNEHHGERASLKEKIKASVRAEVKKIMYDVHVTIRSNNEVLTATCGCPGGVSPAGCKHVFAVLHFVADYCIKKLHLAPTETLRQWHQPSRKVCCSPKKVEDFISQTSVLKNSSPDVNFNALLDLPFNTPIFSVLSDPRFNYEEELYKSSIPLPAIDDCTDILNTYPQDMCLENLLYFHKNVKLSKQECQAIEKKTMCQNNSLWKAERKVRITDSNFHRILRRTDHFDSLSISILNPPDIENIPAVEFGKESKNKVKGMVDEIFTEYRFRNVGLVINPHFPYLAASPDGLLFNNNDQMLVEIKTVYNINHESLDNLLKRKNFCLEKTNNIIKLKQNHMFFDQIQGQLAISNINSCIFALYYDYDKLFHEKIMRDNNYCTTNFVKLQDFYFNFHLKNLMGR